MQKCRQRNAAKSPKVCSKCNPTGTPVPYRSWHWGTDALQNRAQLAESTPFQLARELERLLGLFASRTVWFDPDAAERMVEGYEAVYAHLLENELASSS